MKLKTSLKTGFVTNCGAGCHASRQRTLNPYGACKIYNPYLQLCGTSKRAKSSMFQPYVLACLRMLCPLWVFN